MKILVACSHLDQKGGVANYFRLLVENLNEHDVEHFVQGLRPRYHKKFILPIVYLYQCIKFAFKLKSTKPDVVHLNPSLTWASIIRDIIFLNIAKAQGYPVLFFLRGWRWSLFEKIKKSKFFRKRFTKNLKKADKILGLSKDFKDALVELGIEEDKIGLTSTMVESESYLPENKTFDNPYNILFCSRIAKDKGPNELMEAITQVIENEEDVNFIFMGDGPELENLKRKAKEMDIEEFVTFTGYKIGEEKYEIYKKSHLFVLPSYTEGFPNVVLEAMAAGLPIVSTPVGALKYVIEYGNNGLKLESVPPEPDEIAERIIKLIENPDLMKKMSEHNLQEAKNKYDVEAVTSQMKKIYDGIVES